MTAQSPAILQALRAQEPPADVAGLVERLNASRRELELRFTGALAENTVNALDVAATTITAQAAREARLREALVKAESTFRWYGDLHAAKPDPDKAKRNYEFADEMRAALEGYRHE